MPDAPASAPIPVLGIGLPVPPNLDPDKTALKTIFAAAKAANLALDFHVIDPTHPTETILGPIREKMGSKPYAVVNFGFGIRGDREMTSLFEQLVNVVVKEGSSELKMGFAAHPGDVVASCLRVLGDK